MNEPLLKVEHLKKNFPIRGGVFSKQIGTVKAVDDISFTIHKGETLGLVGESGCGKSTTGRMLLRLLEPSEGKIIFEGNDITKLSNRELRKIRGKMQMIFQDPYASLNPRHTIERILEEPLLVHGVKDKEARQRKVRELLEIVGLNSYHATRYPHQFSGGQRQRIGIARALSLNPKLIIADEPVSALDVSIQAQVLNLMKDLQKNFDLTYLFIAHDLGVVRHISDRVGVMYLGRMVELAESEEVYQNPKHPYTQALLSAVPIADVDYKKERIVLQGDVPSPANPPSGCTFHTRCPLAFEKCAVERPLFKEVEAGHFAACHLHG
ncbi:MULTISPECIES: ABC transporter ATP-binding protein [Heyndrickxia]|jgi:oligopeptide transport system ATP-binding protein|uniref:Dipeptide/oligopeptide/nickel ABC transporter ATP-binding protein n=1 Tax=Heyndrickxia oleronia TaxID=38875 RepID=A0A8E2IB90_9BACI|nr:dipeptide ABC transporter ATP-binding protein [Heyndrickxia oleronia]NYV65442.1 dipeptide ABC transporter ATP-binding protein [Bacillus sp. Gen3]MBU5210092.1 dipeptide ABC transporter ATP-binding protein [Heyndrickxia oleronia]MCI1591334.1 dipeptide ABC transporter ATP-binding protein [Heyndrickxia oleronia]MCI1614160.1 dipeptide ABC transporter ATP-binding protein [Heyndrickxia oleronia]MCI1762938.1 dipeptide ABC transporter ATP-binding protein [Heyndrickxia oleronia]